MASAVIAVLLAFAGVAKAQIVSTPTDSVKGRAPTLTIIIAGDPSGPDDTYMIGDTLTAVLDVSDPDGDTVDFNATRGTIQWYSDTTAVGVPGMQEYTIQPSDQGKRISVRATPHTNPATSDPYMGVETDSSDGVSEEDGGFVTVPDGRRVTSVAITGESTVSQILTAVPSCGASCVGVTYQWQIEATAGSGNYTNITGETGTTYTVRATDQKKKIRVEAFNASP